MPWGCRKILLGLLTLLWLGSFSTPLWAETGLFNGISGDQILRRAFEARAHRLRTVTIDFGLLDHGLNLTEMKIARAPLHLNLFTGISFMARSDLIQTTADGVTVWKGRLEGVPHSEVTLAYKDQVLSGNISFPGTRYWIRFLGNGLHTILEADPNAYPPEKDPRPVYPPEATKNRASQPNAGWPAYSQAGAPGGYHLYLPTVIKPPILDVLVVYTAAARLAAGGSTAMDTLIQLAVNETKTGFINSGIKLSLNLVQTAEVNYNESGFDWDLTLDRLTGTSDGYLDQVHALRDTYRADAVIMLVNDGLFCGQSWLMTIPQPGFATHAFGLVNWDCATGNYSFAHELGHLLGSHHDWNTTTEIGCYSYSKGYQAPDSSFRTIMAYDCLAGCPRINHWSSPGILYNGQPTGVSEGNFHPADNSRSVNNTSATVVHWR